MHPHFSRLENLAALPNGEKVVDCAVEDLHRDTAESVIAGRNVIAGYTRGWGLQFDILRSFVRKDPIFAESMHLTKGVQTVFETSLMNIFLIMKYGIKDRSGDFIEFGCYYGGSALFIANVARRLGFTGTVYALDTFEGIPAAHETLDFHSVGEFEHLSFQEMKAHFDKLGFTNLVPVKGRFEETAAGLLQRSQKIFLAHIDCDTYSSTSYAITTVLPYMDPKSGYLVFDDSIQSTSLGAMQAVEEMIEAQNLHAEQAYPHLVYRFPKLQQ